MRRLTKIHVDLATPQQLRDFATVRMGLEIPQTSNRHTIIGRLRQAGWQGDEIEIETEEALDPQVRRPPSEKVMASELPPELFDLSPTRRPLTADEQKLRDSAYVRVMVPESDRADAPRRIPVGVNGVVLLLERGKLSDIRWPYFIALSNARENVAIKDEDGSIIGWREVSSYPFEVRDGPARAGVEAA